MVLDGATGYGETGSTGPLDTTESFTVAAWVSADRVVPFATAISQVGQVAAAFYLGLGDGGWTFSMTDEDTNEPGHSIRASADGRDVATGTWTHLAGVFDAEAGEIRLYLDGEPAATTPFDDPWQAAGELRVGGAMAHARPGELLVGVDRSGGDLAAGAVRRGRRAGRRRDAAAGTPAAWDDTLAEAEPLRGTWDSLLTTDEVERLAELFGPEEAALNGIPGAETRIRIGFDGQRYWQGFVFDGELWLLDGVPEGDTGVITIDGDQLTVTNGGDGWATYRWTIDGDELTMTLLECVTQDRVGDCPDIDIVRFMTERTYVRSSTDPGY